jgi:hypothetical protein
MPGRSYEIKTLGTLGQAGKGPGLHKAREVRIIFVDDAE